MYKPALYLLIITLFLISQTSALNARQSDPKLSWRGQDQHSFFFSPFSFHGLASTGTSGAISWADASPFLVRSLFPAVSANGNRFFLQYNNIPEKKVTPLASYRYVTTNYMSIIYPPSGPVPHQMFYSDTFQAVRPTISMGYFGNPVEDNERLSAGFTLDIIRSEEPYFGQQYYGWWWQPITFMPELSQDVYPGDAINMNIFMNTNSSNPEMNPLSSVITHRGLRPELSLSWAFGDRLRVGTRWGAAAYSLDGKISDYRIIDTPNNTSTAGNEVHTRRYRHFDMAAGFDFRPSEMTRILFTTGFLTGSSDRDIDITYNMISGMTTTGSRFSTSSVTRHVGYLAAGADHRVTGSVSVSLLITWQRGNGDLDENEQLNSSYSTGFTYPTVAGFLNRSSSMQQSTGEINTREFRSGFLLKHNGQWLRLFTGLWITDHYDSFEIRSVWNMRDTGIQITEEGYSENISVRQTRSGRKDRFETLRYEIPAGAEITLFPWFYLNAAISHTIRKSGNPGESLYAGEGMAGIIFLGAGSTIDPAGYSAESTKYRTDYYFGLTIRPQNSIRIRANLQPVYNPLVESRWMTSLSAEIAL
ncbi:MAG: hypothetical protein ACNA8K_02050 [Cyclonatronaceae bacterium]